MTSRMQPNKMMSDVNDCIVELKRSFSTTQSPIDDDNAVLHRLEEKLELILQLGLKEKPGLLGSKKSYWDYICTCYSTSKRAHDGIQFVKSISELKTSLGRGRAFIRFCLMQKCLADTLQTCFINQKTTRDFYIDRSVPAQVKLWSTFITSLYDLNELNFDLSSRHAELDVTWPSFARKIFVSSENEPTPNRNRSSSSLYSFSSQNEYDVPVVSDTVSLQEDNMSQLSENQLVHTDGKLEELNVKLLEQNQCLKQEVQSLVKEKCDLEMSVQELQKECQYLQQKLSVSISEDVKEIDSQKPTQKEISFPKIFLQEDPLEMKEKSICLEESDNSYQDVAHHSIKDSELNSRNSLELQIKLLQDENYKLLQKLSDFENRLSNKDDSTPMLEIQSSTSEKLTTECSLERELSLLRPLDFKPNVNHTEQNLLSKQRFDMREEKTEAEDKECNISSICDTELPHALLSADVPLKTFSGLSINDFLSEVKSLVSDILDALQICDKSVSTTYRSRLNSMMNVCEIGSFTDAEKIKESLILNHISEKYVDCIKNFAVKQDSLINALHEKIDFSLKGNENLYSKICVLKDLLHSYGFFKLSDECKTKEAPLPMSDSVLSVSSFVSDEFIFDPLLKTSAEPLFDIFKSSFAKLNDLNLKVTKLQCDLNSSQELNNNLITRVREQKMHLKDVTKELEEAQQIVSVMKEQHRKLQSTEGILKYDLQEKRKLLCKLKQQLENTREDWNLVRLKNSKSEVEWQNLRKEFVQRHKQTSEESGFVDDKNVEEQSTALNASCECDFKEENSNDKALLNNCNIEIKDMTDEPKKSRLELLEEQCQLLCSNLIRGSKKRQEIDNRLESMCKAAEKSNEVAQKRNVSSYHTGNNNCENINDMLTGTATEDISENIIIDENFSNSPQSSDIGSLHSECSSCIPVNFSIADSVISSCSLQSPETDSLHAMPCELECVVKMCQLESAHVTDVPSLPDSEIVELYSNSQGYFLNSPNVLSDDILSGPSYDSCTESASNVEVLSQVDSLLIKKKDLEETLKHLNSQNRKFSSDEKKCSENVELSKEILALEHEKRFLQNKVQELEKKTLIISTELDQTAQQLILSKAAKEHEVAALQFQLNTEALKYERALKQFSEQNSGLEGMKMKISDQEQFIHALEEALTEIKVERESEREHQWQELQELQSALEAREQECVTLCQDLEKSISYIEEERIKNDQLLTQFEEFRIYCQKDKKSLEVELINLQNDSKELRKKLIKLLKEKDILWKRSDYLSYLHKAKINNRWVDDHEVSNCLGCKSTFSFMLRKHHCRLCGRIFCYSCSNNWLLTASSSKRIRVCNECYAQYMEMKKDVRRGSDVPHVEDESEDEIADDDLSFNAQSSSSFNSEIPLSIADSVLSLPVKTGDSLKQSNLFASAPDLHCAVKFDEGSSRARSLVREHLLEEADESTVSIDTNENCTLESTLNTSSDSFSQTDKNPVFGPISTNEIEAAKFGVKGTLLLNAGEKTSLSILCQRYPIELQWSFSSNNEVIPVILLHGEDSLNDDKASVCYHSDHKTEDSMELLLPGLYAFQFENTSRITAMKIEYSLKAKYCEKQTSIANLCSSL